MTGIVTYHVVICFGGDDIEEVSLATSIDKEPLGRINIIGHWWKRTDDGTTLFASVRKLYLNLLSIN